MNEFSLKSHCPKCGSKNITTRYQEAGMDNEWPTIMNIPIYEEECLKRCCKRCNYRWAEKCMNVFSIIKERENAR